MVDISSSMKEQRKLAFVQAAIEYLVNQLTENHRFALLTFNEEAQVLCGLTPMTQSNKTACLGLLRTMKAEGSTNISAALFKGVEMLQSRKEQNLSFVFLLTDGLINRGLSAANTLDELRKIDLSSSSCCIHTFGFGSDHDSWMLQEIAFASKGGVYHYVENETKVAATFGQCVAGALSTVVHSVKVRLVGQDGARMIKFNTRFPIKENVKAKDYTVSFGSLYSGESRSMILGLSLRKMEREMQAHPLVKVQVTYTNTLTQTEETLETHIQMRRPAITPKQEFPLELSKQVNRFIAADAIQKAVHAAQKGDFPAAHEQLAAATRSIEASPASQLAYCVDLVKDLNSVARGLADAETFRAGGAHYAHAYATMYYQERSSGLDVDCYSLDEEPDTTSLPVASGVGTRGSKKGQLEAGETNYKLDAEAGRRCGLAAACGPDERSSGYGYVTLLQKEESRKAVAATAAFVSGYVCIE